MNVKNQIANIKLSFSSCFYQKTDFKPFFCWKGGNGLWTKTLQIHNTYLLTSRPLLTLLSDSRQASIHWPTKSQDWKCLMWGCTDGFWAPTTQCARFCTELIKIVKSFCFYKIKKNKKILFLALYATGVTIPC